MKNHWLNKKKDKQEEAILDAVCNEMATGEITIGAGWSSNDVKIEDITWDNAVFDCQPLCISASPYPLEEKQFSTLVSTNYVEPDPAISSITITNDWSSFETALAEMDMEIGDGSIKYVRETGIGTFIFKDAGALGVDIFIGGDKVGWLNSKGEESLKQWLCDKPVALDNVSVMGKTYSIGVDPAAGTDYKKKQQYDRNYDSYIKEVSNEVIDVLFASEYNVYQLKNKNILPGSVILTACINGVAVQSENLNIDGNFNTYPCDRPGLRNCQLDYNTGIITVNWVNFNRLDIHGLSFCYEYSDYEESKLKERWKTIC